ncbi:MAG: DUF3013 family protein [Streptococcaceae bacterium]|nr:DUF3013 family protein [Streptococcaceae bacterium]MCL2858460.1 DUF3013 family protein [Streptococcaceae bacterium]
MAKYGFLDILEEELKNNFSYDYEINWDKKNFAVEVNFLLEVENKEGLALTDANQIESEENILFEDGMIFYNPDKSKMEEEDYLTTIVYSDKGLSQEFLSYFVNFLQETADKGLDDLMDFLADEQAEEFAINFDKEAFEKGVEKLEETEFYKYPRY